MNIQERVLEDDYPVYVSYWYLIDGKPQRSWIEGTVLDLKRVTNATEICNCDAFMRGLM